MFDLYLQDLKITGVQINYYFICKRKLWLFTHHISMEHNSERVKIGQILHEESYKRESKEILVENTINIDFISGKNEIHEVKLSNKMQNADKWQILYYLYFLEERGIKDLKGVIHYPKLKKKEEYSLSDENKIEIENILKEISEIRVMLLPPNVPLMPICRKCSYFEFCWG